MLLDFKVGLRVLQICGPPQLLYNDLACEGLVLGFEFPVDVLEPVYLLVFGHKIVFEFAVLLLSRLDDLVEYVVLVLAQVGTKDISLLGYDIDTPPKGTVLAH